MSGSNTTAPTASGAGVSPGRASGPLVRVADPLPEPAPAPAPADPAAEAARLRPAAETVARRLRARAGATSGETREVLETTAAMATDPTLLGQAEKSVPERSLPAARAVHEAAEQVAEALAAAGSYLAERVRDVRDVAVRIRAELDGVAAPGVPKLAGPSVLVARDLAPADTADLDPDLVLALVTEEGGPTSHTAIVARALGIPAVVAARGVLDAAAAGATVDGGAGWVELHAVAVPAVAAPRTGGEWTGTGRTTDGHPVKLLANIGSPADSRAATAAEGVGLFRTEFCFLAASTEPDAATQRAAYAEVLAPLSEPVVVRTLDAGADKPLPFLNADAEPNPALGVRGLRAAFERPDLLRRQLDAITAAASDTGTAVSVMAPMVATAEEAAWFAKQARQAGLDHVGIMVETPAAALSGAALLDVVDFVSIGTNDLAQYTFAADRMSGTLAGLNDPWQPALLRLIADLASGGRERDKPVGVCGEAAADPDLAVVLAGLGITSLSMTAAALPAVGSRLAQHPLPDCERAARNALTATGPTQARERAREHVHP